jgi:uncharacterized membrane protein
MGKTDYLDALQRAMTGLPQEAQAKTLAYYEQRFVDGVAAGRNEEDVAAELDDPKKIAMTLRANSHMQAFAQKKNPVNLVRMFVSAIGLAIFNLFMVVPAMVYGSLVAALYACAIAFYLVGVVITGSGLSGTSQVDLTGPLRQWAVDHDLYDDGERTRTTVSFSEMGINVTQDPVHATEADRAASEAARAMAEAAAAQEEAAEAQEEAHRARKIMRRAGDLAEGGLVIHTDLDAETRSQQTVFGLAMVIGGILLFLLSLVVTRYTFIGIRRYIEMNLSLLKGH